MAVRDAFAERFLLLKQTYNLSYTDFVKILGVKNKTTVNDWVKSQKGFPNENMLVLISNIFAVSLDWLLGRIDDPYNENILTSLEEKYVIFLLSIALETVAMPLPQSYTNTSLRRKKYTHGQRANLIFAALSSHYKILFNTLKTTDQMTNQEQLRRYISDIKNIDSLIFRDFNTPIFDLEKAFTAQGNGQNNTGKIKIYNTDWRNIYGCKR